MAKVRRKSNGARRGAFKCKKMGKGWLRHRKKVGRPQPVDRSESDAEAGAAAESGDSSAS
ncbi:MAG: hypothetical protein O2865_10645 [Planctomycetota bacterium]|nr:hypothetical protein [Planctomycetota bacterium]MDA0934122.1 hypothetical protein [Planctomycetota bacterium]MDA1222552.1 hypothetical protein [Planctomycetota bacterium]